MSFDRILCLANSYKHDHRCVAGISLVTKKWVRLVGKQVSGCLTVKETCYPDGRQAALLDVFEAELGEDCGSNCHPEDVFVTGKPWRLIRRFDHPHDFTLSRRLCKQGTGCIAGLRRQSLRPQDSRGTPMVNPSELIHPENLWWWIREENSKRKNRAIFRAGNVIRACYDLAVTDPVWMDQLNLLARRHLSPRLLLQG